MENAVHAVELKGITKRFGSNVANNNINLYVDKGVILSLLGENGSGKTTLMNMLSGIYYPDEGEIFVDGKPVVIKSPKDAFDNRIGMIHQHFKLVDIFNATENVVLGLEDEKYDLKAAEERVQEICTRYGFNIDLKKKVYEMSVSEKQTIEIIKVLYRGADILILDEPTAVLTPQETEKLFFILRAMRQDGKAIILITHKLNEVLNVSDVVAILRKGEHVATVRTAETDESKLTEMMVGHAVELDIDRRPVKNPIERIKVSDLSCRNSDGIRTLENISFTAYGGEILGIAGISGSGQKELLESIAGLRKIEKGSICYTPEDGKTIELVGKNPQDIYDAGIALAFVPEDRLGMGLVGSMGMTDNMMLRSWNKSKGIFVDRKEPEKVAKNVFDFLEVVTPNLDFPVKNLSGGNVQKVLVGREISTNPTVFMSAYAVRGLDINTSYHIYNLMAGQKAKGTAVIYVGEDLDVLLELCDRILVLCDGKLSAILDARNTTKEEIGLYMTTVGGKEERSFDYIPEEINDETK